MRKRTANSSCVNSRARRMIFACGVRFIRLKSASVRGLVSRSARAARSMASGLINGKLSGVLRRAIHSNPRYYGKPVHEYAAPRPGLRGSRIGGGDLLLEEL